MEKKKILIVEDETALQEVLSQKLIEAGYEVFQAFDGEQGLSIALSEHPNLILLDIIMPKLDGWSLIKKLREDSWGKHVCVIALTNLGNVDEREKHAGLHLEDYLVKTDWSLESLLKRIKSCAEDHPKDY